MPGVELPASQDPADLLAAVVALRRLADRLEDALQAGLAGNHDLVRELIKGLTPDGTRSGDALVAVRVARAARG